MKITRFKLFDTEGQAALIQGWVDFEAMIAEIDGVQYPVTQMLDREREFTADPDTCVVFIMGHDDQWLAGTVVKTLDS